MDNAACSYKAPPPNANGSPKPSTSPGSSKQPGSQNNQPTKSPNPTQSASGTSLEGSPSPEPSPENGAVCFPADATVEMMDGSHKRMDKLTIGDRVRVSTKEYSEVFMFTHRVPDARSTFVNLHTSDGHVLSLTPGHFLYVNGKLMPAKNVVRGDSLQTADGTSTTVDKVYTAVGEGLYNPQTTHGDIIVNGLRTSTYTTAVQPSSAHSLLAPFRAMYNALGLATCALDGGSDTLVRVAKTAERVL